MVTCPALTGCLSSYLWHSRLADAGAQAEGNQRFEGTLNRSWFHADRSILLEGDMTVVGEDGHARRVSGYLALDKRDASMVRYRFVRGSISFGKPTDTCGEPVALERRVHLSAKPVARYKLTARQGDFDCAPKFIPAGEVDPASRGFRRLAFQGAPESHSNDYAFVVAFDEFGHPLSSEVLDKSGKVLLTPGTLAVDVTTFAVAVPFVVCIGLPYSLLDSCGHQVPPPVVLAPPHEVWLSPEGAIAGQRPRPFVDHDTQVLLDATEP